MFAECFFPSLVLLKVIFYFWPFLRAFWGLCFTFLRVVLGVFGVFCLCLCAFSCGEVGQKDANPFFHRFWFFFPLTKPRFFGYPVFLTHSQMWLPGFQYRVPCCRRRLLSTSLGFQKASHLCNPWYVFVFSRVP